MQPATNDVTSLTRYISNKAVYANVHVLIILSYINFSTFKLFLIDKFFLTSNFLHFFFHFRCSTHNILSNYLKFYPKYFEK